MTRILPMIRTPHVMQRFGICFLLVATLLLGAAFAGANEPVEITVGYYESSGGLGQYHIIMDSIIDRFMAENPHIRVSTSFTGYRAFYERLPVELATGTGPDVWLSDGVLVDQYSAQGFALDLTQLIDEEIDSSEYFGLEDNRDPNGRIWAFPQGMQSSALFYNKEMFESVGVSFPSDRWTMDDLRLAARRLTIDREGSGTPDQYGFRSVNHVTEGWYPVLRAFGGGALDETRQNSIFSSPSTVEGLNFMIQMIHEDRSSPPPGVGGGIFTWFPNQFVAMQYGLYNRTYAANQAGFDYDVTVVPSGPGGRHNPVIVNSWIINSGSTAAKQDAAWEWIKFFSGEEAQTMWAELGEAIPINRQVALSTFLADDAPPDNRLAFVEGLSYSTPLDPNPVWGDWVNAATKALEPAFRGQTSAEQAALQAHHMVQLTLDAFYQANP